MGLPLPDILWTVAGAAATTTRLVVDKGQQAEGIPLLGVFAFHLPRQDHSLPELCTTKRSFNASCLCTSLRLLKTTLVAFVSSLLTPMLVICYFQPAGLSDYIIIYHIY